MAKGKLTISIDLELAWGFWDSLTPEILRLAESAELPICEKLLELFDRYEIPATWAIVSAMLDRNSPQGRPGNAAAWYAPGILERIAAAKISHEIGSHGGWHVYYDRMSAAQALDDLDYVKDMHRENGLALVSFVYPRNRIGHLDLVAAAGLQTFRGPDTGWVRIAGKLWPSLGRLVTFSDKILPIPPAPARPQSRGSLVDIPGSMLLSGRNGPRRYILPQVTRAKLAAGLASARRSGRTFHFWFHPCNFYYRSEEQFATLAWFLERAADEASRGRIEICTMGSYAGHKDKATAAMAAA